MNAHSTILSDSQCKELARITAFRKAANAWADCVALKGGTSSELAMELERQLLVAGCWVWQDSDGNLAEALQVRCDELGVDEEGYPLDAAPEFNPSRVHPDDPCQSKGYL